MEEILLKKMNDSLMWFDDNIEIFKEYMYSACQKHLKNTDLIDDELNQLLLNKNLKSTDFPYLFAFCRDGFHAFHQIWNHFRDDRDKLYYTFYYKVVEVGTYKSMMDYFIDNLVMYQILSILYKTADGSSINFWIAENVVSKEEWEELNIN